jgi:hypothetical protein
MSKLKSNLMVSQREQLGLNKRRKDQQVFPSFSSSF